MPWIVRKLKSGKYGIFKKLGGGKVRKVGQSDNKAKAQASVRARYFAEAGGKSTHRNK